ncbi:MAG TPA: diacylglycerol kinase family protein [Thermosynechococcaceae cyanobacterium]
MPPESGQPPNYPEGKAMPVSKHNRDLAWQIAPSLLVSFRYAWAGISYAFQTQRNFRVHVFLGILAIGMGFWLRLAAVEIAVLGLTIGAVLALELLNTAIESVVDLTVKQTYHDLAKIAKDCAAAAVLIASLVAIVVACTLLIPKLWLLLIPFLPR